MFEALRFGKQEKSLQFCFENSVNVLHVDGISVIYIAVPKLFLLLHYNCVNSCFCFIAPYYIQQVDQLSDIVIYVQSFGEEDRCLHVALPVAASLEMLTKSVTMRATTATRTGCVQHGMGQTMPFSGHVSINAAEDDPRPKILQLNTERFTDNKISVTEQLTYENTAFIIVLQETHCITADKLVIPNFSLAGSILSRNHDLATFVHERLEWSLVNQSPDQSETELLWVDVAGYNIINVYKPPRSQLTATTIPTFPNPSLYVGDFNCQHVNWGCNTTYPDGESLDSWATSKQPWTVVQRKGNSKFFLSPLERRHQPRPGLRKFWPGQLTAGQRCPRKVTAVTTSAFPHSAIKIPGACPQWSGEALELLQGRLEALLPSHRWIHREITTSGHTRYWEGIPRFLQEPTFCG